MTPENESIREDLTRLRDELTPRAFDDRNLVRCANFAEVVWKINSCLGSGYPRRTQKADQVTQKA